MLRISLLLILLSFPTSAFAGGVLLRHADSHLIIMAFLTGFAIFALVQVGYFLTQTFSKAHTRKRMPKKTV